MTLFFRKKLVPLSRKIEKRERRKEACTCIILKDITIFTIHLWNKNEIHLKHFAIHIFCIIFLPGKSSDCSKNRYSNRERTSGKTQIRNSKSVFSKLIYKTFLELSTLIESWIFKINPRWGAFGEFDQWMI